MSSAVPSWNSGGEGQQLLRRLSGSTYCAALTMSECLFEEDTSLMFKCVPDRKVHGYLVQDLGQWRWFQEIHTHIYIYIYISRFSVSWAQIQFLSIEVTEDDFKILIFRLLGPDQDLFFEVSEDEFNRVGKQDIPGFLESFPYETSASVWHPPSPNKQSLGRKTFLFSSLWKPHTYSQSFSTNLVSSCWFMAMVICQWPKSEQTRQQ